MTSTFAEAGEQLIDSFKNLTSMMKHVEDENLQVDFLIWTCELGVGNLIKHIIPKKEDLALFATNFDPQQLEEIDDCMNQMEMEDEESDFSHYFARNENREEVEDLEGRLIFSQKGFDRDKKRKKSKTYKRGPYNSYSEDIKEQAVELYEKNMPVSRISRQMNIPIKNIKRWAEKGIARKEGGGRKGLNFNLELKLKEEIEEKYPFPCEISTEELRMMALNISPDEKFKASRGWVQGFMSRYHLE